MVSKSKKPFISSKRRPKVKINPNGPVFTGKESRKDLIKKISNTLNKQLVQILNKSRKSTSKSKGNTIRNKNSKTLIDGGIELAKLAKDAKDAREAKQEKEALDSRDRKIAKDAADHARKSISAEFRRHKTRDF